MLFIPWVVSDSLWPHKLQHIRLPSPSPSPRVCSNHIHWVSDALLSSHPLLPTSPLVPSLPQNQGLFQWVTSLHQVAKVLELQLQHQSFQWIFKVDFPWDWLVWFPCSPRDSQESSPAPQLKSIDSSALSLFCSLTLTFVHNSWKSQSFDSKYIMAFILATGIWLISVKWTAMHKTKQNPRWITRNRCVRWQGLVNMKTDLKMKLSTIVKCFKQSNRSSFMLEESTSRNWPNKDQENCSAKKLWKSKFCIDHCFYKKWWAIIHCFLRAQ